MSLALERLDTLIKMAYVRIYFNFLPFHLVNVNNDIKARPIVNLSYNENVFKVLFREDTISIFKLCVRHNYSIFQILQVESLNVSMHNYENRGKCYNIVIFTPRVEFHLHVLLDLLYIQFRLYLRDT